jgi:hypothetical protein
MKKDLIEAYPDDVQDGPINLVERSLRESGDHPVKVAPPAKHTIDQVSGKGPILPDELWLPFKGFVKETFRKGT